MNKYGLFLILFTIMIILDLLWLGLIAKDLYRESLGSLLKQPYTLISALLVYIILVAGILFFVLPHPYATTIQKTMIIGALFGLVVYGVYEFTNHALIQGWPLKMVIIDIIWGTILCSTTSVLGKWLA